MAYQITSVTPDEVRLELSVPVIGTSKTITAIVFDNLKGLVRLVGNGGEVAYIAYGDVDYFNIHSHISSTGPNRSVNNVMMHLKNLSSWPLIQTTDRTAAEASVVRLTHAIHLKNATIEMPSPKIPSPPIEVSKAADKTILRWKNKVEAIDVIKLVGVLIAAGAALAWLTPYLIAKSPGFAYLFLGFCYIIYLMAAISQVRLVLKDSSTSYGFSFNSSEVEYFEESTTSRKKKKSLVVPKNQWFGLSYSNGHPGGGQDILMLNLSQSKNYAEQKKAGTAFAEMMKVLDKMESFQRIRFKELSPVERQSAVNWVDKEMRNN
jgi:hypothetical protein